MEVEKKSGEEIKPNEQPNEEVLLDPISTTEDADVIVTDQHPKEEKPSHEADQTANPLSAGELDSQSPQEDQSFTESEHWQQINGKLESIVGTEQRLFSEVREMHKLYHSEFAGRLKSMQDELEQYRKIDKGRAYDDILGAIARIYGNNETLADEVVEPKAKKSIRYMLMDIEDLLSVYGMEKLRSKLGDKRNPRHCQVLNRISTDDPAKHDTVAKSYNSGFYIGNRTVIKEVVDVFIYEEPARTIELEEVNNIEAGDNPVKE